ncbi:MAG: glutamate synthase subunit beta [Deltaproteobacteria bacterium HGW-Deltaproteobacteria-17]|nr:MAG: glutamate synthase subunit beta [Deltaproteobacteria bacterium HGW-Deltaproteobacteria-17]
MSEAFVDANVTLTIDGHTVTVPAASTVLDAARKLGIEIPTFCFMENHKPFASCFMCVVKIEGGRGNLVPSCSTPVSEGMVVRTQSEEISTARKTALELMFSDHLGDCFGPCHEKCPTGVDIPGFIAALKDGDPALALSIIKDSLSLPGCLGRVCPAPCEQDCRRNKVDEAISIMRLKRAAADADLALDAPYVPAAKLPPSGKKVAIVGAGPGGINAAYFLSLLGHEVDVYDAHPAPGGMLRYGIPSFRLPHAVIDAEVAVVEKTGVRFHYGRTLGRDFTLAQLQQSHQAVFLAMGAQDSSAMQVQGEDLPGVVSAVDFLGAVARGDKVNPGARVMVVGGGNSAVDAARTAVRLGASVEMYYRRTRAEMPAWEHEIADAEHDGVKLTLLVAPVRVEPAASGKLSVVCLRMELGEPDAGGRRRPVPVEGSEFSVEVDTVIAAIGQKVSGLGIEDTGLARTRWGTLVVNEVTLATSVPGVFAGGDVVLGPDIAVRAAGMGKMAAVSIHQYLTGQEVRGYRKLFSVNIGTLGDIPAVLYEKYERQARVPWVHEKPEIAVKSFREVAPGLTPAEVLCESSRCLECGCRGADLCKLRAAADVYGPDSHHYSLGAVRERFTDASHPALRFESEKCITCGNCVRICEDEKKCYALAFENRGFSTVVRPPLLKKLAQTACDGCLKCVVACPTGALTASDAVVATEIIRQLP